MNKPDQSRFEKVLLKSLGDVEECMRGLQDVQAGLDLVLRLHSSICADEEGAFFSVLEVLSSTLKDRIERGIELIV